MAHHRFTTAAFVTLFWMIAATLVILSSKAGAAAEIAALVVTAYLYSRFVTREAGISHALGVGTAWLVLSIATEIALASRAGHGWFTLLGPPDRPLLRNVLLFAWIFAPALFARRDTLRSH